MTVMSHTHTHTHTHTHQSISHHPAIQGLVQ